MTLDRAVKLAFLLTATDKMSETLEKAGKNLTGFQKTLADKGAEASRIGGHFMTLGNQIGGGMLNIAKVAAEYAEKSVTNATKVGMQQVSEWQKLAHAANDVGLSEEKLVSGMTHFNETLKAAATGNGTSFFRNVGIQIKDTNGKLRNQQDILAEVANKFASLKGNSAEKSLLSQELFGKGGTEFIQLLNKGADGLKALGKEAEDMGLANGDNTEAGDDLAKSLRKVDAAILSLKVNLGSVMAPVLEMFAKIIASVTGWLSGLVQKYQAVAKVLSGIVGGVGALLFAFGTLKVVIGSFALVFTRCTKIIRGVQYAMIFLKAAIHGTRGATYAAMLTQRQLTIANALHTAGVKIATAAQWLWHGAVTAGKAILTFFTSGVILSGIKIGALAVWQGISTAAQWLFNAALYACPLVWIIAGIMAVIAAVVLLVKYWDDVVAFFGQAWEWIKNIFSSIGEWFAGLWDGIKNIFVNAWNSIFGWLSGIHEKFVQFGKNIIQGLIKGITGAISKLWETIKNIGKKIGGFFAKILGINSPSTVFAKFGMNITQGLVVGIDRGEGAVERATGGLAMQAMSSYGNAVQTVPAGAMFGGMGGAFNYSPTINIGAGVSEETKQDFSAMLRQHYRDIVDIIRRHSEDKTRIAFN